MKNTWNAKTYSQFLDLRTRPSRDLLSVIPTSFQPDTAYDLGCGPGNSTVLLKDRWPHARVVGVDTSLDMLDEARSSYPEISFIEKDIMHFSPSEEIDLIFANASLQWVNDHEVIIPKLIQFLSSKGALAIQMPNNFHSPSHQVTVRLLQDNADWRPLLKNLRYGILTSPYYRLPWYYDLLSSSGLSNLQLWETEYFQEMSDHQAIFDWVSGTALRPILSAMDADNQALFADTYIKTIAKEYPLQSNSKVLLPFRRLFMVGFGGYQKFRLSA